MLKFKVGDLVVLKRDCYIPRRVFKVLAVSEIYDSLKLIEYKSVYCLGSYCSSFWWPVGLVRKVSFYQPDFTFRGC